MAYIGNICQNISDNGSDILLFPCHVTVGSTLAMAWVEIFAIGLRTIQRSLAVVEHSRFR